MELRKVETLARTLMDRHGLYGWTFAFDNGVNRAGACHVTRRKITLSKRLMVGWSEDAVRNVVLHEIAHALAPRGASAHGPEWRAIARRIGCTGNRCWTPSSESPDLPPAWIGVCPNGHVSKRGYHRRPTATRSCSVCHPGRFDPRFVLRYERNLQAA